MELLIYAPEGDAKRVTLENDALSLGRAGDNDLAYPSDPWLSRYHLRFERNGSAWNVRDCESRNGTIVNAASLQAPHMLVPGDRIYAGHLTIEVHADPAETSRGVVSFIPGRGILETKGTVVTNLEKVLNQTRAASDKSRHDDVTLTTTRVVDALIRAGQELASHRPLDKIFQVILDLSLSAVDAMRGVILTLEKDGDLEVRASKGDNFAISTSVRDYVLSEKCSLMISDAQMEEAFREQKSIVAHKVRSVMAVPLQTGERAIGLIYVDTGSLIRPFAQEDLDLLTVMANVAAIRIEQARLIEVEQSEKLMESELAAASEIQRNLLPADNPACDGYEIAGYNLPCHTVGGDYYDFVPYSDGRLALVVGDVAGKGLAASLMMSSLQARVHMLVESCPDPANALTVLNRNVAKRCPPGKFITFFYGLLDPATGKLQYANAGHNYPLLIRADGTSVCLIGHGMVMGILENSKYQTFEAELAPGDMLALFSDGVTEARTADNDEFGEARLAGFLTARRDRPASQIIDELVTYVRDWSGEVVFADDFTMVIVRRS
jgi:serine phosphatase RsbU (regulator of sigma subunit)/pSer/pThr/pTyr-binding forkhead associated (FHA) protein